MYRKWLEPTIHREPIGPLTDDTELETILRA
jgi:hypothetical protein